MTKKLTRHGNSLALVLDRPVLDLLRIDGETPLNISTDGQVLVVAPVRNEKRELEFKEAMAWSHRRYAKTFHTLSERIAVANAYRHVASKHRTVLKRLASSDRR